ncbi:MAG: AraC family transcriptional regulator [Clostridiales Family XIII bacterium]|jgi:AraC-like DNA-binding protein|nr:AraC family transcriptional regulator [Clostridiales Family XIII bacterium]
MSRVDLEGIIRVQSFIDCNYGGSITIEQLSKIACMCASKLKYVFKDATGKTVHQYLTEVRVSKAKCLLAETDMPVSQVALLSGYRKAGAFTAVFKKNTGTKPLDYRKIHSKTAVTEAELNALKNL